MCMNLENRDNLVEGHDYEKKKKTRLIWKEKKVLSNRDYT